MPPIETKNLGLIKAIHVGINPPMNIKIIWYYDGTTPYTTGPAKVHYYYDVISSQWKPLLQIAPVIVKYNENFDGVIGTVITLANSATFIYTLTVGGQVLRLDVDYTFLGDTITLLFTAVSQDFSCVYE